MTAMRRTRTTKLPSPPANVATPRSKRKRNNDGALESPPLSSPERSFTKPQDNQSTSPSGRAKRRRPTIDRTPITGDELDQTEPGSDNFTDDNILISGRITADSIVVENFASRRRPTYDLQRQLTANNVPSLMGAYDVPSQDTGLSYNYDNSLLLPKLPDQSFNTLIRILVLHAGAAESPLACNLKILDLDNLKPLEDSLKGSQDDEYEALSYVWGQWPADDKLEKLSIHIDGERVQSLKITPNLAQALRQLRDPSSHRRFWVDAVCIDQNSDQEKNNQVPLMARIYSEAKNVCIWLGEPMDNGHTLLGVDLIERIRRLRNFNTFVEEHTTCLDWEALLDLMKRKWFTRRWVVQEVAMAKSATLHCGEHKLDWKDFGEAVSLFQEMGDRVRRKFRESADLKNPTDHFGYVKAFSATRLVEDVNQLVQKTEDGKVVRRSLNLETLVSTLTSFRGSVAHDTIYAVLALANDVSGSDAFAKPKTRLTMDIGYRAELEQQSVNPQIILRAARNFRVNKYPVDYNKPFLEVATDFLDIVTKRSSSLDMILRPWVDEDVTKELKRSLPSWIRTLKHLPHRPDRTGRYQRVNPDILVGAPNKKVYSAAGSYPGNWTFGKTQQCWTLTTRGFALERVGFIEEPALAATIPESWFEFVGWEDCEGPTPGDFWRTIVADRDSKGEKCPAWYAQASMVAFDDLSRVDGADARTSHIKDSINSQVVEEFLNRVEAVVWGKRLIKTKERHWLGLAPKTVQTGDTICILFGCSVPVILREHSTNQGIKHYELVGECYLHGMMNGDALKERNDPGRKIRDEEFVIR